ncbi:hypothetical protein BJ956_001716 [Arthrobacter psychrochitiniphilus]|nr:hypothetical protein [Arthrobacter psychrochitiniphilus]
MGVSTIPSPFCGPVEGLHGELLSERSQSTVGAFHQNGGTSWNVEDLTIELAWQRDLSTEFVTGNASLVTEPHAWCAAGR